MNTSTMDLRGKRATIVGLGIEGVALARYLVAQGAQVTVSDSKSEATLEENLHLIAGLPVQLSLGQNRIEDTTEADIVFVSQGVPLGIPALAAAKARGIPFSSATKLFMERCRAPIVGITGSAGKSTTTALIGEIFRAAGRDVIVGGNIGVVLLDRLDEITAKHWVVLEISHTQLELTDRSPRIALVTNISPSHADRYPFEQYVALKERIFAFQQDWDTLVLNWDDPMTLAMASKANGNVAFFSYDSKSDENGTFLHNGSLWLRWDESETPIMPVKDIKLLGAHNIANALAASAVAAAAGISVASMRQAISEFRGVPHRLEWVRLLAGVDYYNDSIATTPVRVIAGLRSFDRPIVLMAGGREKSLPLEEWVDEVNRRCVGVVCFGEAGMMLQNALAPTWGGRSPVVYAPTLEEAVPLTQSLAKPGDIVLLSPACTSFDQYPNFEVRGEHFRELVGKLAEDSTSTKERPS